MIPHTAMSELFHRYAIGARESRLTFSPRPMASWLDNQSDAASGLAKSSGERHKSFYD